MCNSSDRDRKRSHSSSRVPIQFLAVWQCQNHMKPLPWQTFKNLNKIYKISGFKWANQGFFTGRPEQQAVSWKHTFYNRRSTFERKVFTQHEFLLFPLMKKQWRENCGPFYIVKLKEEPWQHQRAASGRWLCPEPLTHGSNPDQTLTTGITHTHVYDHKPKTKKKSNEKNVTAE